MRAYNREYNRRSSVCAIGIHGVASPAGVYRSNDVVIATRRQAAKIGG